LRALASVKQEEVALAPQQHRCKMAVRQRHHPPRPKYKRF
jgi:hypothetical protein